MTQLANGNEVVTPSGNDMALAQKAGRKLSACRGLDSELRLELKTQDETEEFVVPPSAVRVLLRVLSEMGQGNGVVLTPLKAELTTQQAADLLNVSRPHLVKLLDERVIPGRKVGSHRRVLLEDLLAYKRATEEKRHEALDELVALSQDLKMGY